MAIKDKRTGLALVGLGTLAYFFLRKPVAPEEKVAAVTLTFQPIPLPFVPEETAEKILGQIKPKLIPTLSPLGWRLEFSPISMPLPGSIGSVSYTLPSRQLPAMTPWRAKQIYNKFVPKLVKTPLSYYIEIPTITI